MMPYADGLKRGARLQEQADKAIAPEDQGKPEVHDWRRRERNMADAILILEKLGYKL